MTQFHKSLEPLYGAMGKVVYAWAYLEHIIDTCVLGVYHFYDGKAIAPKQQIPRSFNMKIEFLKKSLKTINKLDQKRSEGLALINRVIPLSKQRHDMMHSIFHTTLDDDSFLFSKYDYKNYHKVCELKFTLDEYLDVGNKMLDLANQLVQFSFYLYNPQYSRL
jgi:hypothetical protein